MMSTTINSVPTTLPETSNLPEPDKIAERVIQAEHVSLKFGENAGVVELSLQIPPGVIFGLIGPSGCGKTTTMRLLTGLYKPSVGSIRVLGETPTQFASSTLERIGYMPQHFVLYPQLTVSENLNFAASLYGMGWISRRKRINNLIELIELGDARNRSASQLSGGMQRRLALAAALVNDPMLIFADEPTAGIDPVLRSKFWDYFRGLRDEGRTLLITTQYVGEAAYCDYVGVMRAGKLIDVDTPENLRRKAMGGDVIRLVVEPSDARQARQRLDAQPTVTGVSPSGREPGALYVYTTDAAEALPALVTTLNDDPTIPVQLIEKYDPPFDDVFVKLLEGDREYA